MSGLLSQSTDSTLNLAESVDIENDSARSNLNAYEVTISTSSPPPPPPPPHTHTSGLEQLWNIVVDSDWLWLWDSEINGRVWRKGAHSSGAV